MESCVNVEYCVVPSPLLLQSGCLAKELPLGRGAASTGWLQVMKKMNIGMMIFVAAMFDRGEKKECQLNLLCKY